MIESQVIRFIILLLLCSGLSIRAEGGNGPSQPKRLKEMAAGFAEPSNEWRGKPFWSWNGKLEKDELIRQVGVLKEMGFGGYFMHSRVGLETEYLGDEWFDLINAVSDEGLRQGMMNYLYDEDRWPSGTAGGYVTMEPRYRQRYLTLEILPKDGWTSQPDSSVYAVFSCDLDGTSFRNARRAASREEAATAPGNAILVYYIREAPKDNFYNGYTYVDAMSREATDRYIELTHDEYAKHCGRRLGRDIRGVFTDEPNRGGLFSIFLTGSSRMSIPWTWKLAEEYAKRTWRDFIDDLPRLFLHENGSRYDIVKLLFCEVTQDLFLENFVEPQQRWCRKHGMDYTGHFLHEDNLVAQVSNQGSLMRAYEYQDVPGIDVLSQFNRDYWDAKQVSSVARQTGKKMVLSELYGCSGWQMSFADYKESGDWQALFGVNLRVPHLSWYTMKGEAKRDYPASISFQSAWYRDFKYVEDYYSRLGYFLAQGSPVCDLLLISPIESVMAQMSVDALHPEIALTAYAPEMVETERRYAEIFGWLQGAHVDFDYGDEEMMGRLGKVGRSGGVPVLKVGKAAYKAVLVGNMATIRSSTLALLKKFAAAGGKIILAGEAPSMVDVVASAEPAEFLAEKAIPTDYTQEGIAAAAALAAGKVLSATGEDGAEIPGIFCQARRSKGWTSYVLMSMSGDRTYKNVNISFPEGGYLSEWNCRDGSVRDLGRINGSLTRDFAPFQEYVFTVGKSPFGEKGSDSVTASGNPLPLPDEFGYSLDEPNVLPLDFATFTAEGTGSDKPMEILKIDRMVRSRNGLALRGDAMLQPWFFRKFYDEGKKNYGPLSLTFAFNVETIPEGGVTLCMESPEDFEVTVNGSRLSGEPVGWWVDPCFRRLPLPASMLRCGRNEIVLKTDFTEDKNLEALYLTGDFGVRLDAAGPVVTTLPEKLRIGDAALQGLPFYSGVISYNTGLSGAVFAELTSFGGACVRVRKGDSVNMIAFRPFRAKVPEGEGDIWLDVVLTRRNTFGPLHQVPARTVIYAPGSFLSEGPSWSDAYSLVESGLLEAPVLR